MSDVIQKQFEKFHETIKLNRFKENKILREKRDIVLSKLREGIKKKFEDLNEDEPKWDWFNQGSYDIGTGIVPLNGDYDIDVGLRFYIDKSDFKPVEVKKWVYEALDGHTKLVKIKEPCVTVQYQKNDDPIYHVDLAIYSFSEGIFSDSYYLARGKETASEDKKFWDEADPIELSDKLKDRFSGEQDKQYRRVMRYLKRWKDLKFSKDGNTAPVGIGITVAAYNWFSPSIGIFDGKSDDLKATKNFVSTLINHFHGVIDDENGEHYYRLKVEVPVKPNKDIFDKITNRQMNEFKEKLEVLLEILNQASSETDPHEAAKLLAKQFGDDFPVPEKKETAQAKRAAISTTTSQA